MIFTIYEQIITIYWKKLEKTHIKMFFIHEKLISIIIYSDQKMKLKFIVMHEEKWIHVFLYTKKKYRNKCFFIFKALFSASWSW
jgi:hypothetical protein